MSRLASLRSRNVSADEIEPFLLLHDLGSR